MPNTDAVTSEFGNRFSVAAWLGQSVQDYLFDQEPSPGQSPSLVEQSETLKTEATRTTVQLLVAARCSLAASAGLINASGSQRTKTYLATQVLDAARHVEALTDRLADLGVGTDQLDDAIIAYANPDLLSLAEAALEPIVRGDFIVGLVGENMVVTEIMLAVYEFLEALNRRIDPDFSNVLTSMRADDQRHLEFGRETLEHLVRRHPEKKTEIARFTADLSRHMIHAFADLFRDNPTNEELLRLRADGANGLKIEWQGVNLVEAEPGAIERTIIAVITRRLKKRLGELGMGYRQPAPLEMR